MKFLDRVIIKLIWIHLFLLLFFQVVFHREDAFIEWKQLTKYEGVYENNYSTIVETLQQQ